MAPVTLIIVGAGQRGKIYADFAHANPNVSWVKGVAEPRPLRRQRVAQAFDIPDKHTVADWRALAELPKFADAVVICTLDRQHLEAVEAFAALGYDILCEKPMAVSPSECVSIVEIVERHNVIFGVGHVLRYSPYNQAIKEIIDSGAIGRIVNIQHIEPVGFEHFSHSYVRGNWRKESDTSFSLMTKCCHDLDILNFYLSGQPVSDGGCNLPSRVSSFGGLFHFKPSEKPAAAGGVTRCLECPIEAECAYSAKQIYLPAAGRYVRENRAKHFVEAHVLSPETILPALEDGPYGECVYNGTNDVNDHQVVNLQYQSGATASLTMVAFTDTLTECDRVTRIFGTKGQIVGNMRTFELYDFLSRSTRLHTPPIEGESHGGGDAGVSRAFAAAVSCRDQTLLGVDPHDILASHLLVFAAEKARRESTVVDFADYYRAMTESGSA